VWADAAATYQQDIRSELARVVAPLIDEAERTRLFPTRVVRELSRSGVFRARWAGGPSGDIARGVLLAYEFGRLIAGGIGTGVSLHLETALGVLHRCRERAPQLYESALDRTTLGLERTGSIVTAAAVLLAVVFAGLAVSNVSFIKLLGIGLAVPVVVDATLIRAALVPAFMRVAGEANWWAPGPLRRFYERFGLHEGGEGEQRPSDGMASRLGLRPGARVTVVGDIHADLTQALQRAACRLVSSPLAADIMIVRARRASDLVRLAELRGDLTSAGVIWVIRPRDKLVRSVQAAGRAAGFAACPTITLSGEYVADFLAVSDA
jgi:hypothetical protein